MVYPIRLIGDPILKKRALEVQDFANIPQIAHSMFETMFEARGVGLAGPQVGLGLRLFVFAEYHEQEDQEEGAEEPPLEAIVKQKWVVVNPHVTARSGQELGTEGCLSLPGLYHEEVPRSEWIKLEYQDEHGAAHTLEAEGYLARVIQHELDHLDGVFYFERLGKEDKALFLAEHATEIKEFKRQAKALLKELDR